MSNVSSAIVEQRESWRRFETLSGSKGLQPTSRDVRFTGSVDIMKRRNEFTKGMKWGKR